MFCSETELIGTGPSLEFPLGIAVEAQGSFVVVDLDLQAVIRIDPMNGDRTVVSGCSVLFCSEPELIGRGPPFNVLEDIAVEAQGSFVVVDSFINDLGAVIRIDPTSGDRTIVSGCTDEFCPETRGTGAPTNFSVPAIEVTATGSLAVTDLNIAGGVVVRIDALSGDRFITAFLEFLRE